MNTSMTKGNPLKLILLFSLPMMAGSLFQQLYNVADTFIVGRTIGTNALAALGATGSVIFLIVGFAFGTTAGMSIVTAQRFGAGDEAGVRRSFTTSVVLTGIITAVLTTVSVVFARPFLEMMRTPAEIIDDAYLYMIIVSWCTFATMLYNLLSSFLRAVGNSRTPLKFLIVASLTNIALDFVLILGFGMGVEGAAIATVISQLASGLLCLRYLFRKSNFRITREDWRITRKDLFEHLRVALPMGLQSSIISVGALALQYALNGLGTAAVAAFAAAGKLDGIATMPLDRLGAAMSTYAAQNYGAGKYNRVKQGVRQVAVLSVSIAAVLGLVNIFFGRVLAGFFLQGNAEALSLSHIYLKINGCCYVLLALLFVFRYTLQGLGKTVAPTLAGGMELVMRTMSGVVLAASFGFAGASIAGPLAWAGALIPLSTSLFFTLRRLCRTETAAPAQENAAVAATQ